MKLAPELFATVVAHTPLVSIDLILRSADQRILLGQRLNKPAQGFWFVPGGRVFKDERLEAALARTVHTELGSGVAPEGWRLLGVYEHLYPGESHTAAPGVSTHYVVLGVEKQLSQDASAVELNTKDQHDSARWWTVEELLASPEVHDNTKAYFRAGSPWLSLP